MGDPARLEADEQRVARDTVPERADEVTGRDAEEDRRDRQDEKCERDRSRGCERRGEQRPHLGFGSPKPPLTSSNRPRFDSTLRMKPAAAPRRLLTLTTAIS